MSMTESEIYDGLKDMFQDVLPDEEALEDDEDLQEEIDELQNMISENTEPMKIQIDKLADFNNEWFPDGLDQEEQDEFRELLDAAEALA